MAPGRLSLWSLHETMHRMCFLLRVTGFVATIVVVQFPAFGRLLTPGLKPANDTRGRKSPRFDLAVLHRVQFCVCAHYFLKYLIFGRLLETTPQNPVQELAHARRVPGFRPRR